MKIQIEIEIDAASEETSEIMADWKAAFIEDAAELHLCTKKIFALAIAGWLEETAVRTSFLRGG
ncbi:MAG: hypothetical protein ABIR98_00440, partial [Usitatibacter sp.]